MLDGQRQFLIGSVTLCTIQSHPVSSFKRPKVSSSHTPVSQLLHLILKGPDEVRDCVGI